MNQRLEPQRSVISSVVVILPIAAGAYPYVEMIISRKAVMDLYKRV